MKVLVTGGAGFIGSVLVRKLLAQGHKVRVLVHQSYTRLDKLNVEQVKGSVTNPENLRACMEGIEIVFHLAARTSDWGPWCVFFRVNAEGTHNTLEAAIHAGVQRFVHMSTLAVHQFRGYVDADESIPADQERYAYGASKAAAERYVRSAHAYGRIATTIIRPGVVIFGPEDTTAFVHMAPLLQNGRWTHVAHGRLLMCYSYVENLVDGIIQAGMKKQGEGETFVITDDMRLSWYEFIHAVIEVFGVKDKSISFPVSVARAAGIIAEYIWRAGQSKVPPPITDYRTALVARDFHFSCGKAKEILGYGPELGFKEGLMRTVEWYKNLDLKKGV